MLNKFNSNTKKLNKIIIDKNFNNLLNLMSITSSLENIKEPKQQSISKTKKLDFTHPNTNINTLPNLFSVTSSLDNIKEPSKQINSNTKYDAYNVPIISNKNVIDNFHLDLFKFGARNILKNVSVIEKTPIGRDESYLNKLIINNVLLDYGVEEPSAENFEVFIDGLHIPGIFIVKQNGNNIEIIFTENWVIDDRVEPDAIKVFGKIKEI